VLHEKRFVERVDSLERESAMSGGPLATGKRVAFWTFKRRSKGEKKRFLAMERVKNIIREQLGKTGQAHAVRPTREEVGKNQ